jgi:hypothetical protein
VALVTLSCGLLAARAGSREALDIRIEFREPAAGGELKTPPRLLPGSPGVEITPLSVSFNPGRRKKAEMSAHVSWDKPMGPPRKPHEIWSYLLDTGTPGQRARLRDDPGLTPGAPVVTVVTADDDTRGFSIGLEQLARHKAMWLPEHGAFVTLNSAPVDFRTHRRMLDGERTLDRTRRSAEASLAEYTSRWEDIGNPDQWKAPWQTRWLGTEGHLIGTVARHGSLYKFGVDRWGNVRPDFASPHKFRWDVLWPESQWVGQRIVNGLPVIVTSLNRAGQTCEIEQFAAPLRDAPPAKSGEIASVFFSRLKFQGNGPMQVGFRLATENRDRHPEWREIDGRPCVVDRETGSVWLMIEPSPGITLTPRPAIADEKNPQIEFDAAGHLNAGNTEVLVFKLPSPALAQAEAGLLSSLDYAAAHHDTVAYWESWLDRGARFEVPEPAVNELFRANLWHALMLPRFREEGRIDLPYSNFAYGQSNADWPINQAVYVDYMLYGLRGYFEVAEEEFAAMFLSQQKPDGRISGYAEWGVYSPGMLYAIGQNFLLGQDRTFFERLLPSSLKTLHWCLTQVAQGQKANEAPGLIVAPLNDLTHEAKAWAFPNAYFVGGLEAFGQALATYGHPQADAALAAARQLRTKVESAFARASVKSPVVQLADGTWNNYVPTDALTPRRLLEVWYPTDVDCGPMHLPRLRAIDPRGWLSTALLHDHEDNLFLHEWGAANEPVYNAQATAYLLRDEPEAAIRAFYSMMACAFSHRQCSPLEHRWAWGQYYCPPSTDGAWFELYRNMLLNELGDGLAVGQAVPRAWLADGKRIAVTQAPTYFGPVNLVIESATKRREIRTQVEFASSLRPPVLRIRLRHPDHRTLRSVTVNGKPWRDFDRGQEWVRIPQPKLGRYLVIGRY